MTRFVVGRLAWTLAVVVAITILTFLIFFAAPGVDPAHQLAGRGATPAAVATIKHDFGLDRSLPVRYALMMKHLVIDRDLTSYSQGRVKVLPQLVDAAPVTFSLVLGATLLWLFAGVLIGVLAASGRRLLDPLLMGAGLIAISIPTFLLGDLLNLITQDRLHGFFLFSWIPPLGYVPFAQSPWGWFSHLVVPWITLSVAYIGIYSRVLRSKLQEVSEADFVRTARAKGLSPRRILVAHTLRNSLLTLVSIFGLDFAGLVAGGALVTEVVFGLPGIGALTFHAFQDLDLPVIMATVIYGAIFVVLANTAVDILYAWLDPRTRSSGFDPAT
jgi:peptide/nickel transport system permease protein